MANHYFITGFPGFIASSLVRQIIRDGYDIGHIHLLVQSAFMEKANEAVKKIAKEENISTERFSLISGDITKPELGLPVPLNEQLRQEITHVLHLAAVYDLAVPEDIAQRVNVEGTRHVNQWILTLKNIKRYVYFSTSYVSGNREGTIYETELEMNQKFKNHYERTKYDAEVLVRGIMNQVPTTVIRPGIVVGHSKTGETIKFDGPYFILNFFGKLKFLPIIPYLGAGEAEGNFVPIDYIFCATSYLGHAEIGEGKTYQLVDPKPYRAHEVYRLLMKEYLGREPMGRIPLSWARWFLSIPFFRRWVRVEKEALDYFTCKANYDAAQAQADLKGSGITCPDFKDVVGPVVRFYKEHKNDESKQIKIR